MLLGLWPHVMRRVIGLRYDTEFSSFTVAIVADRAVGTLNASTPKGPSNYIVFSFNYSQEWEQRVVAWMVNLLCCTVGQVSRIGINYGLLPRLEGLLTSHTGLGSVSLVPLRLNDLNKCLVDVSVRVMGGTDVHTILNHLQTLIKDFV